VKEQRQSKGLKQEKKGKAVKCCAALKKQKYSQNLAVVISPPLGWRMPCFELIEGR